MNSPKNFLSIPSQPLSFAWLHAFGQRNFIDLPYPAIAYKTSFIKSLREISGMYFVEERVLYTIEHQSYFSIFRQSRNKNLKITIIN